jgi:hypothetical protein
VCIVLLHYYYHTYLYIVIYSVYMYCEKGGRKEDEEEDFASVTHTHAYVSQYDSTERD